MGKRLIRIIALCLMAGLNLRAADITVTATVDRSAIKLDEVITFTVSIEGTRDFPDVPPPTSDGFVIISGPSQSSSIQIINGKMSASKTIQWRLAPTRTGSQKINPIEIRYRRKTYRTKALTVSVNDRRSSSGPSATAAGGNQTGQKPPAATTGRKGLFLRAEVPKTSIYKGEELPVSFNLYFQNVRNYAPQKLPDAKGFWTEAFPEKRNPTISSEVIDGVSYKKATLRRLSLFPTTTGELVIDPMEITCEVPAPNKRSRSALNDFFDDSFFNDPFFSRTRTVAIESAPVRIQVKDLPSAGKPAGFSGAVGNFVIEGRIDTLQTRQNQALTLQYTISGSGNINAVKLPPLELSSNVEIFEPTVERTINNKGKRIRGTVTYEYVLIPRSSGTLRIPGLNFSYFDPKRNQYMTSTAPGYSVKVSPAKAGDSGSRAGFRKEEISLLGSDIRFISRDNPHWRRIGASVFRTFWFWFFNLFFVALMGGSLGFRWWMEKLAGDSRLARRRRALSRAQQLLKEIQTEPAGENTGDLCGKMDRVLSGFISDRLGLAPSGLGPRDIETALTGKRVDHELVRAVVTQLERLERLRFLPGEQPDADFQKLGDETARLLTLLTKEI